MADAPDAAGREVTVEIRPPQVRQFGTVIDDAAGHRAGLGVMVLGDRLRERVRPRLAVQVERMRALQDAPAVVSALLDEVDLLPDVLAVVADPQIAALGVDVQPPGVAEAVGPSLRDNALVADERVV